MRRQIAPFARTLTAFIVLAVWSATALSAEPLGGDEAWRFLEQAGIVFEKGEFGDALALCEKAREKHSTEIVRRIEILKAALLPGQ